MHPTTLDPGAGRPAKPSVAVLDILIVVAVSAAAYGAEMFARSAGLIPLGEDSEGVVGVLAGAAAALTLVFARGGGWRDLGFKRPQRLWTVPLWAIGIFAAYLLVSNAAPILVSQFMTLPEPDLSRHDSIAGNLGLAIAMALILPFTASIPEEIIYRGFLMGRLTKIFGAGAVGAIVVVVAQSALFGSVHVFGWGVGGAIVTTMMGAVWGTAYLLCGRNLWITIAAHSLGHVLLVAQLYASPPAA